MEDNTAPLPESVKPETVTESNPSVLEETGKAAVTSADTQTSSEPETSTGKDSDAIPETRENRRIRDLVERAKHAEWERDAAIHQLREIKAKPLVSDADFPDETSRQLAIADHVLQEGERRAFARTAEAAHGRAVQARDQAFAERVAEFKARAPDFDQVAFRHPNQGGPVITPDMADLIKESESGAQVAYWLGNHPEQAARIASLPERQRAKEIGKIEARIEASPVVRRTTEAPRPPKTLSGANAASSSLDEMDHDAYRKMRMGK